MYHPFLWKERSKEWLILFIQCLEGKLKVLEFELYGWMQNDQLNSFSETQSTYTVSLVIKKKFKSMQLYLGPLHFRDYRKANLHTIWMVC